MGLKLPFGPKPVSRPRLMSSPIVIVTGLSGSGKTLALRTLEDSGFFCVDNLPPQLMSDFIKVAGQRKDVSSIGIGMDIREGEFLHCIVEVIKRLRKDRGLMVLFLEAEEDVLIRRFKETRRPHPLQGESIEKSIAAEARALGPLRQQADRIIDTTVFTPQQLRQVIASMLGGDGPAFRIHIMSFGFKFGVPPSADMVFDARFLSNPFFVPGLRDLTGLDDAVKSYVAADPLTADFVRRLEDLLGFLIPQYRREGKSALTICIGCTGGRHRSPAIAEMMAAKLSGSGLPVNVIHRDL